MDNFDKFFPVRIYVAGLKAERGVPHVQQLVLGDRSPITIASTTKGALAAAKLFFVAKVSIRKYQTKNSQPSYLIRGKSSKSWSATIAHFQGHIAKYWDEPGEELCTTYYGGKQKTGTQKFFKAIFPDSTQEDKKRNIKEKTIRFSTNKVEDTDILIYDSDNDAVIADFDQLIQVLRSLLSLNELSEVSVEILPRSMPTILSLEESEENSNTKDDFPKALDRLKRKLTKDFGDTRSRKFLHHYEDFREKIESQIRSTGHNDDKLNSFLRPLYTMPLPQTALRGSHEINSTLEGISQGRKLKALCPVIYPSALSTLLRVSQRYLPFLDIEYQNLSNSIEIADFITDGDRPDFIVAAVDPFVLRGQSSYQQYRVLQYLHVSPQKLVGDGEIAIPDGSSAVLQKDSLSSQGKNLKTFDVYPADILEILAAKEKGVGLISWDPVIDVSGNESEGQDSWRFWNIYIALLYNKELGYNKPALREFRHIFSSEWFKARFSVDETIAFLLQQPNFLKQFAAATFTD